MTKKQIYKPKPVSGFPEWLPHERLVEQQWFDQIRRVFESYGYANIETPSVEELDVLNAKGEDGDDVDKEVYVIERLHKEDGDKDARLALHFDLTVPLARYVAQHFNELVFPFKRYQMQRVWRGERPQAGRFREFYQCDIDVINVDALPLHFDAEMPAIMWEILSTLPGMDGEQVQIRISNRKILLGLIESLGITDSTTVTRFIDKLEKIGHDEVLRILIKDIGLSHDQAKTILALAETKDLGTVTPANVQMKEGLEELSFVLDQLSHLPPGAVVADLSIVRGLDYYTGTVYETVFLDDPDYGSICSGGRYDDLAGNYINKHLPGVGISLGFSRLFDRIRQKGKLPASRHSPADVLVLLGEETHRAPAAAKATELRQKGYNVEMYHSAQKMGKQFSYAEKKGIPFTLVPMDDGSWEIKNMNDRSQKPETEGLKDLESFNNKRA